jgi:hypothetical protein
MLKLISVSRTSKQSLQSRLPAARNCAPRGSSSTTVTANLYEKAKPLLEAGLGDEIVALDTAGGECFGFNDVAAAVWRLLDRPCTFEDVMAALSSEYETDSPACAAEVREFLAVLASKGLVKLR